MFSPSFVLVGVLGELNLVTFMWLQLGRYEKRRWQQQILSPTYIVSTIEKRKSNYGYQSALFIFRVIGDSLSGSIDLSSSE